MPQAVQRGVGEGQAQQAADERGEHVLVEDLGQDGAPFGAEGFADPDLGHALFHPREAEAGQVDRRDQQQDQQDQRPFAVLGADDRPFAFVVEPIPDIHAVDPSVVRSGQVERPGRVGEVKAAFRFEYLPEDGLPVGFVPHQHHDDHAVVPVLFLGRDRDPDVAVGFAEDRRDVLDHSQHPEGHELDLDGLAHGVFAGEQPGGHALRQDGDLHARVELFPAEGASRQERKGHQLPVIGVGGTQQGVEGFARSLAVDQPQDIAHVGIDHGDQFGGFQSQQVFFGQGVADVAAPRAVVAPGGVVLHVLVDVQRLVAVDLRGHDDVLHLVGQDHHHEHHSGQGRPHDGDDAEESVLPEHLPGLLDIDFIHKAGSLKVIGPGGRRRNGRCAPCVWPVARRG